MTHLLAPEDLDDPSRPSGGNVYDRRIRDELRERGFRLDPLAGASALADVADGETVLVDGLIAGAAPESLLPHAHRLDLVLLIHVPPGLEPGSTVAPGVGELLRAARAVVTTSRWCARRLQDYRIESIAVAEPGADPAPQAPGNDGATSLLAVGSLTPTKGHDLLVTALRELDDLAWRCRIVGTSSRDPAFAARLRGMLTDRITLVGPLAGEALATEYAAADLLVVPSRIESYGMVITEALARAIPVLAANTGGVAEALGSAAVPELLVAPQDTASLAAALRRWLTDPGLRARARLRAADRRETLVGWSRTADVLEAVLTRRSEVLP